MKDKHIKMTYNNYISMSTNSTSEYLMLSELIDNSISSYEVELGEEYQEWPDSMKIMIEIDIHTNAIAGKKREKIHNNVIQNGSYIKVTDNAFGMNEEILWKSIEIDNKKIIQGSNKNVHGRGMKQSAFFFGMGIIIETNNGKTPLRMEIDMTKVKDLSEPFTREIVAGNLNQRGTQIIINNIYDSRINIKKTYDKIVESLKARYWKYIYSNRLEISIKTDFNKEDIIDKSSEEPIYLNIDTIDNFLKEQNYNEAIKEIKDLILKINMVPSKIGKHQELHPKLKQLIKTTMIEAYSNKSEYKWKYKEIEFGIFEKIKLDINFWKNGSSKNYSEYRGIYIFDGGRAIKHGPKDGAYIEWMQRISHSSGSTDNKFFGEFDITSIPQIKAINDKSDIQMLNDIKTELDDFIYWNWFIFDKVENFIRKDDRTASSNFNHIPVQKKLIERFSSFNAKNNVESLLSTNIKVSKEKDLIGEFNINGENWIIEIKSNNSNAKTSIIIEEIFRDNEIKKITTIFNDKAEIWNNANKTNATDFYSNVLFPIIIQLTVLYINLEMKKLDFKKSINNDISTVGDLID